MSDWVGRTLSKVEIEERLGRGGMAEVYLGRHTTLNRPVAIKILHSHLLEDENLIGRFRSEAQAVAGMRHPNIVQIFDFDIIEDRPYIVMELLEGPSLKDYFTETQYQERPLTTDEIVKLITDVASALDYAHSRGIVHRDVKPANVVLRSDKSKFDPAQPLPANVEAVLTDFGIARMANASVQTASGVIVGTPAYMSPEQVRGEQIDHRTDIYALGIMLYELLAGELPFEADTQAAILIHHLTETPKPLKNVSFEVQQVVDKALAKNPDQRFSSAGEFAEALRQAIIEGAWDSSAYIPSPTQTRASAPTATSPAPKAQETATMAAASGTSRPGGISPIMIGAGVGVVAIVVAIILIITLSGGPKDETLADVSPTTAETEEVVAPEETTQVPEETPETPETPEAEPTEEVVVEPSPTIDVTIPRGRAEFSDTAVFLLMEAVESLESGFTYEGWLIPEEGDPVSIGLLNGNEIAFEAEGDPLLLAYKGVGLSLEPENDTDPAVNGAFMYTAMVDEALLNHARALYKHTFNRGASFQDALLQGIVSQARQYDSHLGFSVDSINNSNLPGAKSHGEHMINIASGIEDTANYGDWNGDGRVENPGDNVGLETYLHLLGESIRSLPDAEDHQDLLDSIDQYILTVQDARRLGQRITAADTVGEVSTFPTDLSNLKLSSAISQLVNAVSELDLKIAAEVFREAP